MASPIEQAMRQICDEKGLSYESVLEAISSALAAAYRKDFGNKLQNVEAEFNPATGATKVFDVKTVVEDFDLAELEKADLERRARAEALAEQIRVAREKGEPLPSFDLDAEIGPRFNPKTEIMISEAKKIKEDAALGEVLRIELPQAGEFGRMAAMTAKQVITQKLREAEREIIFAEFKQLEGQMINGTVQRKEGRVTLVDLGRITGILRVEDQSPSEQYRPGERIKVYVKSVSLGARGPEIVLSRTAEEMVQRIFQNEIPEIGEGRVVLHGIAREPGARSKVAVSGSDDQIDPIGACIGQRGTRIQTIISEMGGEKIDIIEWNADPAVFIANALSPAKIIKVELIDSEKKAIVHVPADQLSLAIGKGGQNVRLATKLTGWNLSISENTAPVEVAPVTDEAKKDDVTADKTVEAAPVVETETAPVEKKKKTKKVKSEKDEAKESDEEKSVE